MITEGKPIGEITAADLVGQVESGVPEGKVVEYKRDLPGMSDAEKKEFLFDVTSFANASGGYLFYGFDEEGGIPKKITGILIPEPDSEILRLESIILDGVEPRIPGLELRFIAITDSAHVLAIHIPKSWLLPHMVTFKGISKFYSRNSGGKYRLDVGELRSLFALSSTVAEQVRKFRTDRLSQIIADETPIPLNTHTRQILHLVPLESFSPTATISLSSAARVGYHLCPLGSSGYDTRFNLEGLLYHNGHLSRIGSAYLQLYRNGIIETVNTSILIANGNQNSIPSSLFENTLIQYISHYLSALRELEIHPPVAVMLSLVGVKEYRMAVGAQFPGGAEIDRDVLVIPEILLEKFECSPTDLKPMFDAVWNAAGWSESKNFDAQGNYVPY